MDWLLATTQIHSAFSSLGSLVGDTYVVNPNALEILEEINNKLTYEYQTLHTFRRAIGFGQNLQMNLIPLLKNATDENVLDSVIRLLVNLTVPIECLFSVDSMCLSNVGRHTLFEMEMLLHSSKEAFTDPKSTKPVMEYIQHILESEKKLSLQKCDKINNCLMLLRNILHIPEVNANFVLTAVPAISNGQHINSMQNAILWNLFIQNIDKLLIYLMTCPQRSYWGVSMVQVIALIYKDQHVGTLQKLLNLWFEESLSESSEDNESNTSPSKKTSGNSSPMLTSDPTSDSSENGTYGCKVDEEKRQSLGKETEAILQEVNRRGQEYKNSMNRVPDKKLDEFNTSEKQFEEICTSPEAPATKLTENIPKFEQEENKEHSEENISSDFLTVEESEKPEEFIKNQEIGRQEKTNCLKISDEEPENSMPPPFLPSNALGEAKKSSKAGTTQSVMKVPHSGQLNLIKGKSCPQKRQCPSSQSEFSDYGYATQLENKESISTSSDEDECMQKSQHQKPPCNSKPRIKQRTVLNAVDKKDLRRKKLVKRSKTNLTNVKGLGQHPPTDDDISNLLKEFTVDFLLKGYRHLVEELHSQLLSNMKIPIDTSHFFWLVTYFLKFSAQLELDMEHINSVLIFDVIGYLTYEGVALCEQLELYSQKEGSDLKPYLRRMHLVVTAIREFLHAIETYKKVAHLSEADHERLSDLQYQISSSEDLRCLFVLLLRRYNPSLHTKQYLQDLVVTNHMLLLILDGVSEFKSNPNFKMIDHISQFATLEVMNYYGILLEDFNINGEFVNDCIFTMMHHVGGDIGQINTLFQPNILKTFSRIWESGYELCDDWSDLIEHVIHKFVTKPQKDTLNLPTSSLTKLTKEHNMENNQCTWTQDELDAIYWYFVQSKKNSDIVGKIVQLFDNNGNKQKSRTSVIQQLLQQDIITLIEYDDLIRYEDAEYQGSHTPTLSSESGVELRNSSITSDISADDIQNLIDLIVKDKKDQHLIWLQKCLLECCYIKLMLKKRLLDKEIQKLEYIMEPVAYHCILKNQPITIVPWNNEQANTMLYQPFTFLLQKLGIQLPANVGSIFPCIPDCWTAESMYDLAKKLGSLEKIFIKFDLNDLDDVETEDLNSSFYQHTMPRNSLSSISSLEVDSTNSEGYLSRRDSTLTPLLEEDIKMEKSDTNDTFSVPTAKHCNSIIRFTPEVTSAVSVPNWLQLVMRSKCGEPLPHFAQKGSTPMPNKMLDVHVATSCKSNLSTQAIPTIKTLPKTQTTTKNSTTSVSCTSISNLIGLNNDQTSNINNSTMLEQNNTVITSPTTHSKLKEHKKLHLLQQQSSDDDSAFKSFESSDSNSFVRSVNTNLEHEYSAMIESICENEIFNYSDNDSVVSDLSRMYVSDEDERHEFEISQII